MSIISQALKKAQREQRVHSMQPLLLPTLAYPFRPQPRVWFVITLGCGLALGVGALLYAWLTPFPTPPTAVMRATVLPTSSHISKPTPSAIPSAAMVAMMPGATTALPSEMVAASQPGGTPMPAHQLAATAAPDANTVASPEPQRPPDPRPAETAARSKAPELPTASQRTEAHTHFNLALAAQTTGDLERAMTLLQQAISLDPTLKHAYNNLGNLYYQRQQYDDAVAMYHQALALDPDYMQARNNLGSAYIQLSQYEQAIAELQKVLQADGASSLAYYNLACVYARTGDSTQAVHYLQRAVEIEPQARLWAQTDADFSRIRTEPAFQRLLGSS